MKKIQIYIEKLFTLPLRTIFEKLAGWIKHTIDTFIGEKRLSSWYALQKIKSFRLSSYGKLQKKRAERRRERKRALSAYEKIKARRLKKKVNRSGS